MNTLPTKPSALIRLALSDLSKCESDPRYSIDMKVWHKPLNGVCHVCLAGSVLANSLEFNPFEEVLDFITLDRSASDSLLELNLFRVGYQITTKLIPKVRHIPEYKPSTSLAFHSAMEAFAQEFENVGL